MLVEATDHHFETLIAGTASPGLTLPDGNIEAPEVLEMLRQLARSIQQSVIPAAWMIVGKKEVVGLLSITKVLTKSSVEIGYGVAKARRGRGVGTRAVRDVLSLLADHPLITEVLVETSVENVASQRVLEHNGFQRVGQRTDEEDGELFCWRVTLAKS